MAFVFAICVAVCAGEDSSKFTVGALPSAGARGFVTNVAQFKGVTDEMFRDGCDFHLLGAVTLVDTNRNLVVLQDATGAVAVNYPFSGSGPRIGQFVVLDGTNCCPTLGLFPDYPYRPAGADIRRSFEGPINWGEFHLTRMRGFLHPPVSGEYTFWIASDNSSELWLSADSQASRARRIASVARFQWVSPRQWSKFPSQRSEPVFLKAGESYYIEAFSEQTTVDENLAVAWQGPNLAQSVIAGGFLTPWGATAETTNGVLREYWTNFYAGDLRDITAPRQFESAITAQKVVARVLGPAEMPRARQISLGQPIQKENNYNWVEVHGRVQFVGTDKAGDFLEITDAGGRTQVRLHGGNAAVSRRTRGELVSIQGVCEGTYSETGTLEPGLIWAPATNSLSVIAAASTNFDTGVAIEQPMPSPTQTNGAMQGFYGTRGVVTFAGRAFGKDYLFVQEDAIPMLVSVDDIHLNDNLKVGDWVDLGGALQTGEPISTLKPLVAAVLGIHTMPAPVAEPLELPGVANREGRWSELEGVVHSVNTNGTLFIATKSGPACLWLGQISSNGLSRYIDAKLRVRGVLMLSLLEAPLLLVPSRAFVDVEEEPPDDSSRFEFSSIADVIHAASETPFPHRTRIVGTIIYRDSSSFLVQDGSAGIRVQCAPYSDLKVGQSVQVLAFPGINGAGRILTDAEVRVLDDAAPLSAKELDLNDPMSSTQSDVLVRIEATLLSQNANGKVQVLELQEQRRVFTATLPDTAGNLPRIEPGSRVQAMGVCDNGAVLPPGVANRSENLRSLASLNILLRSPSDVTVLSGPPWWTWKRTAVLVSALFTVLAVTLLWVHLLRRRLEHQQAAQVAFSRLVLEQIEDERRRIAVNLHDSLGQTLLAIKNQALLAIHRPPDDQGMRRRLDEISGVTSQAIEEVRQITHGLRPYQLDRLGLTQAIRASIEGVTTGGSILFAVRVENIDGLFDKDAEIHVYRIVQEAVTNVVKHSAATEGAVVIKKRGDVVSLSIRDNGRGFDPARVSSQAQYLGFGLNGIAERVRILGGKLSIESRTGEGTNLTVEVPLPMNTYDKGRNGIDRG